MEVAVNKTPAQTIMTVLHSEGLGDVCVNCDPDGVISDAYQQGKPIAQTVVLPVLA
jgi:Zn-dependent membrane protease YugP